MAAISAIGGQPEMMMPVHPEPVDDVGPHGHRDTQADRDAGRPGVPV